MTPHTPALGQQEMHTPGPWKIAGASHVYAPGANGANICSVSEPRATEWVQYTELSYDSDGIEEAYANARLIAAAPELLEALRNITPPMPSESAICHVGLLKQSECGNCSRIAAAHAAIAKATA